MSCTGMEISFHLDGQLAILATRATHPTPRRIKDGNVEMIRLVLERGYSGTDSHLNLQEHTR